MNRAHLAASLPGFEGVPVPERLTVAHLEALLWLRVLGMSSTVRLAVALYGDHFIGVQATAADDREAVREARRARARDVLRRASGHLADLARLGLTGHVDGADRRYWAANADGVALADFVAERIVAGRAPRLPLAPELPAPPTAAGCTCSACTGWKQLTRGLQGGGDA